MATAITAHCVMAMKPEFAELYGCYGLLDDVSPGVTYANGAILVPNGSGIGVMFERNRCRQRLDYAIFELIASRHEPCLPDCAADSSCRRSASARCGFDATACRQRGYGHGRS